LFAPIPRPPRSSEKQYITVEEDGEISDKQPLPCWYDKNAALKTMVKEKKISREESFQITEAEVFMSLVIPAYNEQDRLSGMLEEAVEYLEEQYGDHASKSNDNGKLEVNGKQGHAGKGWEIILVSDGSKDKTVEVALNFARTHQLVKPPPTPKGPWNPPGSEKPTNILPGTIRVVQLEENRGKGGAVTHGMRHARGTYVVFADADGASRFTDLGKLVAACEEAKGKDGRAVGVGSRAHMVGTEAVVQVSLSIDAVPSVKLISRREAFCPPKPPHASFSSWYLAPHNSTRSADQRHPVRLQALLAAVFALHYPIHALRRLDLRCGNAHVGGECRYSNGRGTDWVEGGHGEQIERHQR
jgi:dolichyl-phosphate beta-glucosyltransferase